MEKAEPIQPKPTCPGFRCRNSHNQQVGARSEGDPTLPALGPWVLERRQTEDKGNENEKGKEAITLGLVSRRLRESNEQIGLRQ